MKQKRFILPESEIPTQWYNIQADMPNKPMPMLNPKTGEPVKPEDLYELFSREASNQELNMTDVWIDIPERVREMYTYYRSTPLVRAYGLEKALGTPAHIYFKNESVSPIGSHKLNSALAQAYYCKQEGVTNVTTETGAGQWGAALSYAAKVFGLEAAVYQVKVSYEQKPYRRFCGSEIMTVNMLLLFTESLCRCVKYARQLWAEGCFAYCRSKSNRSESVNCIGLVTWGKTTGAHADSPC